MTNQKIVGAVFMDTLITIEIVGTSSEAEAAKRLECAFGWFDFVERHCSRFDRQSELMKLCSGVPGVPRKVTPLLFKALEFAVVVAQESNGAFDPTVGRSLECKGFNQNYRNRELVDSAPISSNVDYRSILLDYEAQTVCLLEPMILDLGAVAKGLATDLAAAELACFAGFAINAGGDVLVHGRNADNQPWQIGIRHPRQTEALVELLAASDVAICTSGDYERPSPDGDGHHIIQPSTGDSVSSVASVTAIAPNAMLADALSTAAFALGPELGIELLERSGVAGLLITPDLSRFETGSFACWRA